VASSVASMLLGSWSIEALRSSMEPNLVVKILMELVRSAMTAISVGSEVDAGGVLWGISDDEFALSSSM